MESGLEIEVKITVDAEAVRARLRELGAEVRRPRSFEDNVLFDRDGALAAVGCLLRLRTQAGEARLTFKGPATRPEDAVGMKVVSETETGVESPAAMRGILEQMGYRPVYRYQKYREELRLDGLTVTVDETPIGDFVELEGSPDRIRAVAEKLDVDPETFLDVSYRELHRRDCEARGVPMGDLVFSGEARS